MGEAIRHSNRAITEAEVRTMRQLGANSLRSAPKFLLEMGRRHEDSGQIFGKGQISHAMGFPVPTSRPNRNLNEPEAGCPFGPNVPQATAAAVQRSLEDNLRIPVPQVWALTVDEIGSVFDRSPEGKSHSFADNPEAVALASKAAHLIGKTEAVLYGAKWAVPAEVAIVKPRCSEFLGNDAQWENAKWVYTALAHAHIPVDPIDEVMVAQDDLTKYKLIYLNGSHLPRKSALALAQWVRNGGILWTSGFGCARDEANEPLTALQPVLGLEDRKEPELWYKVARYKATAVQSFADPKAQLGKVPPGARIEGAGPYAASFLPLVGREILKPAPGTQVLARYADGTAAMTEHRYGQGKACVVGFYPGLEYSAPVRDGAADMAKAFDSARRSFIAVPALAVTQPVVATSGMLDKDLPLSREGKAITLTLPHLQEGDVLMLE